MVPAIAIPVETVFITARARNGFISFLRVGGFQCGCDGPCQIACGTASPVVEENHARFFPDHVMMDGDNVDAGLAERFEGGLEFVSEHDEVTVHDGVVVGAGESGPGIDAHFFPRFTAAGHFDGTSENGFEHAVLGFALRAENFLESLDSQEAFGRQTSGREALGGFRVCRADFLHGIESSADGFGQRGGVSFAADVHEIDFGFIKKEMVVQGCHLEAVIESGAHYRIDFILHEDEVAHVPLRYYLSFQA